MATKSFKKQKYKYGFAMPDTSVYKSKKGLTEEIVSNISDLKKEVDWMRDFRLKSLKIFGKKKMPPWGPDLSGLDFGNIHYFVRPGEKKKSWSKVPKYIKETFDRIGIPEAEKKLFAGVGAQYDSEVIYHSLKKDLEKQGVIFLDTDSALKKYPEMFKEYFSKIIPPGDNKFAALNSAVWSGGSFIYVPKGVKIKKPLQAYFRINSPNMGQFERTLIIADEGSEIHYVEGCTAPTYTTASLHSAVVEIYVKKGAKVRYTTIQNWSGNVYNLVTKRMRIEEGGFGEWIDCNLGSKVTMKYPSCYLMGRGAKGEILSMAYAGKGQNQDAGGKIIHCAPDTSGRIISKSISQYGGRASYRGLIKVQKGAKRSKSKVVCDALILDSKSRSDTYPKMDILEKDCKIEHEATVSKIGDQQIFYLMSKGLSQEEAETMIVNGFVSSIVKELPLEYAIEMNKLIELQMEGSIG